MNLFNNYDVGYVYLILDFENNFLVFLTSNFKCLSLKHSF